MSVRSEIRTAVWMLVVLTLITGLVYPLLITGIGHVFFPRQARGSLIVQNGREVGSALIGQPFSAARYFWGRPSATNPPYNAAASAGSNLGPSNPVLADSVGARIAVLRSADPGNVDPVPVDLVTSSASGLDPDLTPAAALYQVPRVARARGIEEARVRRLVLGHVVGRQIGILGEPRVRVLDLNLALDALSGAH